MQGKGVSPTSTPSAIPRVGFTTSGHNDLELVGDEWGDRANAALLLLHGGGQNRHAWRGTAGRLAASGYFVTTVDARGHGDSSWSANHKYEMEHLALDVLHLLDRFDRPPAVVGASMGGMSALLAQSMSERQLFSAVVLVDVTPRMEVTGVQRILSFMTAHPSGFATLEDAAAVISAYNPRRERSTQLDGFRKVLHERGGRWHWRWDPAFLSSKADQFADRATTEQRMKQMADEHRLHPTVQGRHHEAWAARYRNGRGPRCLTDFSPALRARIGPSGDRPSLEGTPPIFGLGDAGVKLSSVATDLEGSRPTPCSTPGWPASVTRRSSPSWPGGVNNRNESEPAPDSDLRLVLNSAGRHREQAA